jgi:Flp pilus assembly protein TadG
MRRTGEQGSVMIEAALVFSLLLTIMVGLADFGRYLLAYHFVAFAAHEATRYAEVHGSTSKQPATAESIEAYVKRMAMGVDPASLRVRTAWTPNNDPGGTVRVEVAVGGLTGRSEMVVLH